MDELRKSPFLTRVEAADFLRIDARTLDNLRYKGHGPRYRKHGGKVLYHEDDLTHWSGKNDCGSGAGPENDFG